MSRTPGCGGECSRRRLPEWRRISTSLTAALRCAAPRVALGLALLLLAGCQPKDEETIDTTAMPETAAPKLVIEEEVFKFEDMELGTTQSHTFVLKNEGDTVLKLTNIGGSCSCITGELKKTELAPGESTELIATWTPFQEDEEFQKSVGLVTDDPKATTARVTVEGRVASVFDFQPEKGWFLGELAKEKPTPLLGVFYTTVLDSVTVSNIETTSEFVTAKAEPLTKDELAQLDENAKAGVRIVGEIAIGVPVGTFDQQLKLKVAERPELIIPMPIRAANSGPLRILGEGWTAAQMTVNLGSFESPRGTQRKLTVFLTEPEGHEAPLNVTGITTSPDYIQCRLVPKDMGANAKQKVFTLELEIPKDIAPTVRSKDNPADVKITTDHPLLPEMSLRIQYVAIQRRS